MRWNDQRVPATSDIPLNPLAVDARHPALVVARARRLGQLVVDRGCVLLQIVAALRARDGDKVVALGEDPRDRELGGRDALLCRDLLHLRRQREVRFQVFAGEARASAAEVALVEFVGRAEAAGEKAAAERRVGDESDSELAAGGED